MFPNFNNTGVNPMGMGNNPNNVPNMNLMGMGGFPPGMMGSLPGMPPMGMMSGLNNPLLGGMAGMGSMPGVGGMAGVINPLLAGMSNPFLRANPAQQVGSQPAATTEVSKKVFVKNIPPDVSDTFMEFLLKECGPLVSWKRTRNEKDIPVSFGVCEFESVESVLRCLRIMNNLELLNNKLQIKPADKTEAYIKEWLEQKRGEWEEYQKDKSKEGSSGDMVEDFESFLQKDDGPALDKINLHIEAVREAKEREEEKKEHPRERERENKKKQLLKDNERAFKKKLSDWLQREETKERERKRDREREKERTRERQRRLERELNYDSDEEKRRNSKNPKQIDERKKYRQRETEEDELERKRLEQEELARQEAENNLPLPLDSILPQEPEGSEMEIEAPKAERQRQRKKFVFTSVPDSSDVQQPNGQTTHEQQKPSAAEDAGSISFNLSIAKNQKQATLAPSSAFSNQEMEDENSLYSRKIRPIFDRPQETQPQVPSTNASSDPATQKSESTQASQTGAKGENETQSTDQAKTEASKQAIDENLIKKIQEIVSKIPKNKHDLFDYPINWTLLATSEITENIRKWLVQKSQEYIGTEEINFINMILKKLANRESPKDILKKVKIVLEDDAEDFVVKMWRFIIFEMLKLEHNISGNV